MKKSLSAFLFIWLFSLSLHAELKDLTINADQVSFEKEKYRVEAEGSVEVVYKDFLLHGNHLIYNTSAETVFADRGFDFYHEGISLEGDTLDYAIGSKEGQATKISFFYQGARLTGERVFLGPGEIHLKGASFTTCDLASPHYRVTAADVTLYPKYDWLVAYWGFFWLGGVPVVPMPTYIYDFRAEEKARRNLPPFPDIGYNDEDGNYISERLAWNLRREMSGSYVLSYAANKGMGGGVEANYIANDQNEGNARLYGNLKDGPYGGVTHTFSFGEQVEPSRSQPLDFLRPPRYYQYELEVALSSRERINYQKVSYLPNLTLRSRRRELLRKEAKLDLELLAGRVEEEGNTSLLRDGGKVRLYGDFPETSIGYITPYLGWDGLFYSERGKWIKTTGGVDLTKSFSADLSLSLGYLHYLFAEGQSPFNYEMYRFRAADRLNSSLLFKVGETGAKVAASYFLDNWSPEDIDYSLFFKIHCYNLTVTYRSLRREFAMGVSLASQ